LPEVPSGVIEQFAFAAVILSGVYMTALGGCAWLSPLRVRRFLLGHASTPFLHWLEMSLRVVIGVAFVIHAPAMRYAQAFTGLGWLILGTTAVLMLVPWRWHLEFAKRSVPQALRFLPLIGVAALLMGGFVLVAALTRLG